MIGLGVGIDYSLLIVSRFRQERDAGARGARRDRRLDRHRGLGVAVRRACASPSRCAGCGSRASRTSRRSASPPRCSSPSWCSPRSRCCPRCSASSGRTSTGCGCCRSASTCKAEGTGFWYRWGHEVARRAWWFLVASLIVLLLLAAPALEHAARLHHRRRRARPGTTQRAGLRPRDRGLRRRPERPAAAHGLAPERDRRPTRRRRSPRPRSCSPRSRRRRASRR